MIGPVEARAEGVVEFNEGLYVAPELLGESFTFDLAPSWTICLTFPALPDDLTPEVLELVSPRPVTHRAMRPDLPGWGMVGHGIPHSGERLLNAVVHHVAIVALLREVLDEEEASTADALGRALEPWGRLATQWITLWSGQQMSHLREPEAIAQGQVRVTHDDRSPVLSGWYEIPHVYIDGVNQVITRPVMAGAFAAAAAGVAPALPWRLLIADNIGDARRSMIDLATAVEVAQADAIKARLSDQPEDARELVVLQAGGIVGLYRLWLELNPDAAEAAPSVRRVIDQLATPRNNAAHGGQSPPGDTLPRARATARAVLDIVCPLPAPEELAVP
jgi:hypothetical protein